MAETHKSLSEPVEEQSNKKLIVKPVLTSVIKLNFFSYLKSTVLAPLPADTGRHATTDSKSVPKPHPPHHPTFTAHTYTLAKSKSLNRFS